MIVFEIWVQSYLPLLIILFQIVSRAFLFISPDVARVCDFVASKIKSQTLSERLAFWFCSGVYSSPPCSENSEGDTPKCLRKMVEK